MAEQAQLNISPLRVPLRVEDYLMLDDAGAFEAYSKTELIEGEIVFMNSQHRPHAVIKSRLHVQIAVALAAINRGFEAIVEGSIAVPPHNVPEPDIVVTSAPDGKGLIPLESVALIVEVADATLSNDLGRKQRVYAAHAVPEYWVVDVNARLIHQMSAPAGETYRCHVQIGFGEPLQSASIPALIVPTTSL
jgi:Uma2 family endonuclease